MPVETAADMEIDQGGLRQHFLDDFHTCLKKPRTKRAAFSQLRTGPTAVINQRKLAQKPKSQKTSRAQNRRHYRRLLTDVNIFEHHCKTSVASLRLIHIASEQPIHIAGIRTHAVRLHANVICSLCELTFEHRHTRLRVGQNRSIERCLQVRIVAIERLSDVGTA